MKTVLELYNDLVGYAEDMDDCRFDVTTRDSMEAFVESLGEPAARGEGWARWEAKSRGGRGYPEDLYVFDDGERRFVWSSNMATFRARLKRGNP